MANEVCLQELVTRYLLPGKSQVLRPEQASDGEVGACDSAYEQARSTRTALALSHKVDVGVVWLLSQFFQEMV